MARTRGPRLQTRGEYVARRAALDVLTRKTAASAGSAGSAGLGDVPLEVLDLIAARAPDDQAAMRAASRDLRRVVNARARPAIERAMVAGRILQKHRYKYRLEYRRDDPVQGAPWMTATELSAWLARAIEAAAPPSMANDVDMHWTFRVDPAQKVGGYDIKYVQIVIKAWVAGLPPPQPPRAVDVEIIPVKTERVTELRSGVPHTRHVPHGRGSMWVAVRRVSPYTYVTVWQRHPRAVLERLLIVLTAFRSVGRRRPELALRPVCQLTNRPLPVQADLPALLGTIFDQVRLIPGPT